MWSPIKLCPVCRAAAKPVQRDDLEGPHRCANGHTSSASEASSPQERFLASTCSEALYGGAAGGGKSESLLIGALRYAHIPRYHGLILRRTFPELKRHLIDRAHAVFPELGGRHVGHTWKFPDAAGRIDMGGKIELASL